MYNRFLYLIQWNLVCDAWVTKQQSFKKAVNKMNKVIY